ALFRSVPAGVRPAPARCAQVLDVSRHQRSRLGRLVDVGFERLAHGYGRVLGRALRFPLLILILGAAVFTASIFVFVALPKEMVPPQGQSRLLVLITTAVGTVL